MQRFIPLNETQLQRIAPSVFTLGQSERVSDRYTQNRALWTLAEKMAELKGVKLAA